MGKKKLSVLFFPILIIFIRLRNGTTVEKVEENYEQKTKEAGRARSEIQGAEVTENVLFILK